MSSAPNHCLENSRQITSPNPSQPADHQVSIIACLMYALSLISFIQVDTRMDQLPPSQNGRICSDRHQPASSSSLTASIPRITVPSFAFCHPHALVVMLQAAEFALVERLSEDAVNRFLKMESAKVLFQQPNNRTSDRIVQDIPKTIDTVLIRLGLSQPIIHATCCPSCFSIYPPPIRPTAYAIRKKKQYDIPSVTHCTSQFYSTSKRYVQSLNAELPPCGAALFKDPSPIRDYPFTPVRTFSYRTLAEWIASKICHPNFEDLLDSPLSHALA